MTLVFTDTPLSATRGLCPTCDLVPGFIKIEIFLGQCIHFLERDASPVISREIINDVYAHLMRALNATQFIIANE